MLCPKCRNEVTGKWCKFCGSSLETEETVHINNYNSSARQTEPSPDKPEDVRDKFYADTYTNHDTSRYAPIKPSATKDVYSDDAAEMNAAADAEYYNTDKELSPYPYYEEPKSNKTKIIVILSVCLVVLVAAVFVLLKFIFPSGDETSLPPDEEKPSQTENEDTKALYKNAEKYMTIGDYEAAEEVYLELTELTDDEEALVLYNILYNYNRAYAKFDDCNYEEAQKLFDKIPIEYVDYVISDDVDDLGDEIEMGLNAYEIFENIKDYMDGGDFEAAADEAELIDDDYLSQSDKEDLKKILEEIDELEEEKKKEEAAYDLTSHEAESLLMEYCDAMVEAINSNDFSLVSPYIDPSSDFYETQRGMVDYCASEGITESFDSLRIKSLSKLSSQSWDAAVSETETIFYEDGTQETKTYSWTYTIKYIDSDYYISGIR